MRSNVLPAALSALVLAATALAVPAPAQAGLLDLLFGRSPGPSRAPVYAAPPSFDEPEAPRRSATRRTGGGGGSRSICVRLCDGYYYPLDSVATHVGSSQSDCEQSCPGVAMGVFHVSGDAVAEARDLTGRRYADLPAAFSYRTSVAPSCSCHAASTRANVMGDMTLRSGDIVVTTSGAVVYRGGAEETHRTSDFEDIRSSRALKGNAFTLADRVLGFSFQDGQARKAAVQLAARPPAQDIVVTPLRTGTVSPAAQAEAQAGEALPASGARVILPMPATLQN